MNKEIRSDNDQLLLRSFIGGDESAITTLIERHRKKVYNYILMLVKDQIEQDVRNLIDHLPVEQREVVVLRHYFDLSFKEIAQQTGVSINTALGRMRYALINLRKLIDEKQIAFA